MITIDEEKTTVLTDQERQELKDECIGFWKYWAAQQKNKYIKRIELDKEDRDQHD